jgi:tetratricopeptide (TPR) repeat protein
MRKFAILGAVAVAAVLAFSVPVLCQTAQDYIVKGDEFYVQFNDQEALAQYLQALNLEPANYEALWKTARAYVDLGDLLDPSLKDLKAKQMATYQSGEDYARKAIKANANDTWGYFQLAAAMGKRLLLMSTGEQVKMSREVKGYIDKAVALDSTNDLGYHALGRWQRRMAEIGGLKRFLGGLFYGGIPKGSFEESEKDLRKAIELKPTYGNHHLELGRTLLALKKYKEAAQEFQACIDAPIITSKCHLYKIEAEKELADVSKKIK